MEGVLRRTVVIGPEAWVEIPTTELAPGTVVEVLVFPKLEARPPLSEKERQAALQRAWKLSDQAISNGMEPWSIDRINAEVAQRRAGGYWPERFDVSETE